MELHIASMENVNCWAFRKLCHGATDSYTGMISMNYLIRRTKAWKEVDTYPISGQKQWVQVVTAKEAECAEFISRLQRELNANPEKDSLYGIQLNASSPSPNVIKLGQGPALIKRTSKLLSLLKELLKQDKFKVGLKVRLGLNESDIKQRKLFLLLEEIEKLSDPNFTRLTVHFKHAREPSYTSYNYEWLKEILSFKIPLVINGGIKNYNDFNNITKNISNKKSLVGLMIGREVLKNPDCFIEFNKILNNLSLPLRTPIQIKKEFEALCAEHEPKPIYLETIKEYCPWYK